MLTAPATAFSRFRAGDQAAFDELVAEYTGPAYATAIRVLREPTKAEEAVQEAFVRIWQRARQFDPERGIERSWILSVVRNSSIDALRRDNRARERSIDEGPAVYELRDPDDVWQQVLSRLTRERVVVGSAVTAAGSTGSGRESVLPGDKARRHRP